MNLSGKIAVSNWQRGRRDTRPEVSRLVDSDECVSLWRFVIERAERDRDDYFFWDGSFNHIANLLGKNPDAAMSRLVENGTIKPRGIWNEARSNHRAIRGQWIAQPIYETGASSGPAKSPCSVYEWERWIARWNPQTEWSEWVASPEAEVKAMWRDGCSTYVPFPGRLIVGWRAYRRNNGRQF